MSASLATAQSSPRSTAAGNQLGLMTLLLDGIMGKDSHAVTYEKYCLIVAECNSLVNPIIYSFRDEEMRRTFKCILCCLCRRSSDHQGEQSPVEFTTLQPEVG